MAEFNREDIIKALECFHQRILNTNLAEKITETEIIAIIDAIDLIKQLTEEKRQIFEEIEKKIAEEDNIFEKCASRIVGSDYCNGRSETIGFVLNLIADLKKKYIGEGK